MRSYRSSVRNVLITGLTHAGRRQLELQLAQFWFANRHLLLPHEPSLSFRTLDTTLKLDGALDETGRALDLARIMRWKAGTDQDGNQTGLSHVRMIAIQALNGAVLHHCVRGLNSATADAHRVSPIRNDSSTRGSYHTSACRSRSRRQRIRPPSKVVSRRSRSDENLSIVHSSIARTTRLLS